MSETKLSKTMLPILLAGGDDHKYDHNSDYEDHREKGKKISARAAAI